ncbi:hypothetical protein BH11PSE4_BH11PSE4_07310 [soil metagenome]
MRRSQRLVTAAVLIALGSALSGCGSVGNWDPSDMLDFLDTKKKLPGERKPVFPEGVPGVQQGVPKELYKDNVERELREQNAAAVAPPPVPAEQPKPRAKSRGRVNVGAVRSAPAPSEPDAAPEENTAGAPPAPKPARIVRRRTTAPPADSSTAAPAEPATTPFPAPMPSGTFTR